MEQEITPTLKAIHICNSHEPPHHQKLQKSMSLPTLTDKQNGRTPACNSVYVAIAGVVVNRRSVLLRNFVLNGKESASNPLLHIHANRWQPFEKNR